MNHRSLASLVRGSWRLLVLCGLVLGLVDSSVARAEGVKVHLESVAIDKLPELRAYVSVVDEDSKPIRSKSGFKLQMDGNPLTDLTTTVQSFAESKEPMDVFVVVQVSSVMKDGLGAAKTGITRLAKTLAKIPDSRIGLISYSSEYKKLEELGRPNEVARELDRLKIDEDATETRMLDGVRVAIDLLRESVGKRKMVVVFSDGIDAAGTKDSYEQVGKKAHDAGVGLATIGYGPFEAGRLRNLIEMSKAAGSTARGSKNAGDIPHHFEQLVDEIVSTHVVRFGLTQSGDGQQHVFQVMFRSGKDDIASESFTVAQLPQFEPADPAGWPWYYWVLAVAGGLLGLIILLAIIGSLMGPKR
ncbi:MAG TPA: VWA domain-containing protein [Pseudomonadota bacterium]|jgi:hypothetical protein|nr:VWA domain-containing protein [Pseudomonadota bacterium]HNI58384.1 VWA domain-containing protein [Pseudomonadota bacterium]HNN49483.1 VWA domain-containing protein [Pseudomonadota bacterium]HNO67913.1 VWA domain-containing protein [Pseudomonadota bacterium]